MLKLAPPVFSGNDMENTLSWLNDPVLMQYSEQKHKKHTVQSQVEYIDSLKHPHQYKKIICNDTYIGTISAIIDTINSIADVGILIGRPFVGMGHGCHAWRLFQLELEKLDIRKIEAGCRAKNTAMIRIFEKTGMRLEGTRKYHFVAGAGYDDMVLYGMLT